MIVPHGRRRLGALFLTLLWAAMLAACAGNPPPPQSLPAIPLPDPESVSHSGSEAQPPAEPPAPVEADTAFLTGLPRGEDYPTDRRITAVMVNNIAASRPISGLADAKIVVEIQVEGGITRFMALYEDYEKLPKTGSVRSARDQFFQILLPFWGFFVHEGPSEAGHPMNEMLNNYDYHEFDLQSSSGAIEWIDRPGYTNQDYRAYTNAELVMKAVENTSASDHRAYGSPIFNFRPNSRGARIPTYGAAPGVAVIHSHNYRTLFEFDREAGRYAMSMFSEYSGEVEPTLDENTGAQLAFDNLLVLFAPMENYADSELVKVDYGVGGGGYYFSQGAYEPLVWRKGAPNEPLMLYKDSENIDMVQVNPGTTYLAVVDDANLPAFNDVLVNGGAGAAVAGGEMNPGRVDTTD